MAAGSKQQEAGDAAAVAGEHTTAATEALAVAAEALAAADCPEFAGCSTIALLGGTFDPPHNGHLALACGVADALQLERIWLMPAGNPHFKLGNQVTGAQDRLVMTRLLAQGDSRLAVSSMEVRRAGVTYTAETLSKIHESYPQARLLFVIGGDSAQHIWRWRAAQTIAQLCTVVAVARPGFDFDAACAAVKASGLGFDMCCVHVDVPDVSSTQVRSLAASGKSLDGLVPPAVERYICEHGLYRR